MINENILTLFLCLVHMNAHDISGVTTLVFNERGIVELAKSGCEFL